MTELRYLLVSSTGHSDEVTCRDWRELTQELDTFVRRHGPIDLMYRLP